MDCELLFSDLRLLAEHCQQDHGLVQTPTLECLSCDKTYHGLPSLRMHVNDEHQREGSSQLLECPVCLKDFRVRRYLTDHMRNAHRGEEAHTCSECGKYFKYSRNLTYHMRAAHGIEPKGNAVLKAAAKKAPTSSITLYFCQDCGKSYKSQQNLKVHMQAHSGVYKYNCEICGRNFKEKVLYEGHMNRHAGKRPFVCTRCGRGFFRKVNMQHHEKECGHDKSTVHECEDCQEDFRSMKSFQRHMKAVHGVVFEAEEAADFSALELEELVQLEMPEEVLIKEEALDQGSLVTEEVQEEEMITESTDMS